MAYADSIRAVTATMSTVASLIEGTLVDKYVITSVTSHALATTTLTDMTSMTQSVTVATGEAVFFYFTGVCTVGTASDGIELQLNRDATSLCLKQMGSASANDGKDMSIVYIDAPAAGTYTYKVQFRNYVGARTATFFNRQMVILKVQYT